MLPGLQSGLSALQSAQIGMDVVSQNLANAATPDYHRQVVDLRDREPVRRGPLWVGAGVDVERIRRIQDAIVQQQLVASTSLSAAQQAQLEVASQLEELVAGGSSPLHIRVQAFFDQLVELTSRPQDLSVRRAVLHAAQQVADEVNRLADHTDQLRAGIDGELAAAVQKANGLAAEIAKVNQQIRNVRHQGSPPNDLLDRRDQLIRQLAELVDVQLNEGEDVVVAAGGRWLIASTPPAKLAVKVDANGEAVLQVAGAADTFLPETGRLAGLLDGRDVLLRNYRRDLDQLVAQWIQQIDGQYAAGIAPGTAGYSSLIGNRAWSRDDLPADQLNLVPPLAGGSLYVGVTDVETGQRTLTRIDIDPAAQSLSDIAAAVGGIDHLQAFVVEPSNTLQIISEAGYRFDFTGRPSTVPDLALYSGTATPEVSGVYTGNENDELVVTAMKSGEIGVTDDLTFEVTNGAGQLVAILQVGKGYSPGTAIDLGNGLSVELGPGAVTLGDSFRIPLVAQSDTAGVLAATGMNSFFVGTGAHGLAVRSDLVADPTGLALTTTGLAGETVNLARLVAQRDLLAVDGLTLEQRASQTIVAPGIHARQLEDALDQTRLVQQQLQAHRDAVSGVDPNEEFVMLLQYQRQFQAGAQVLRTIHETTADLLNIIG